jgi:LuxR family maltose regulon positive regulatory protein
VRSRLLSGRGELTGAVAVLDDLQGQALHRPKWLDQEVTLGRARLTAAMGNPDEALAAAGGPDVQDVAQAAVVSAIALLAQGNGKCARKLVTPVVCGTESRTPLLIEGWLVLAVAASEESMPAMVRDSLRRALALAAPEGHRRSFHQGGRRLRQLLRSDPQLMAAYQALSVPASRMRPPGPSPAPVPAGALILVESLSKRELQVLHHLGAMLGTEEIADAMYVSVNTIKTHVRSVLRKLSASRRNEAVRRARQLGLL